MILNMGAEKYDPECPKHSLHHFPKTCTILAEMITK